MTMTEYHPGGYDPAAPAGNVAVLIDLDAGICTRWDTDGTQIEHRPLTDDERAALTPLPVEPTEDQRIDALVAAAAQQQAQLDELTDLLLFGGE